MEETVNKNNDNIGNNLLFMENQSNNKNFQDANNARRSAENEFVGGPQFEEGGWGSRVNKWIKRNSRTVILPVIALVILGTGLYLYTKEKNETGNTNLEESVEINNEVAQKENGYEIETKEDIMNEKSEIKIKDGLVTVKANSGDGITHLARKALKEYLGFHAQDFDITPEHKIYIEDYLKDATGTQPLQIGNELSFSENLIQKAINDSKSLTESQLNNLTQYVNLISSF